MNDNTLKRPDFWAQNDAWWADLLARSTPRPGNNGRPIAEADCPFCGVKSACIVNRDTGAFLCFSCDSDGTAEEFAREKMLLDAFTDAIDDGTITVIRVGDDKPPSVRMLGADPELPQTGLDERRPDVWQRFRDVVGRVVADAKRRSEH